MGKLKSAARGGSYKFRPSSTTIGPMPFPAGKSDPKYQENIHSTSLHVAEYHDRHSVSNEDTKELLRELDLI